VVFKLFLFRKKSRGKQYYYIAENKKVNGKSVRAWEVYVGPVESILTMVQQKKDRTSEKMAETVIKEVKVFEYGAVAALLDICKRLQLREIANHHVDKKRDQGLDTGMYLLLMVINRCVKPRSKKKLASWYKHTFLRRQLGIPLKGLTSQRFWDHMGYLTPEVIKRIEKDLVKLLVEKFGVELDNLLYDPTNFATYLSHHHDRGNELAQWGYNKQKRSDLLQVNLALMVTRQDGIPILHDVYRGNINDSTEFKAMTGEIITRYNDLQLTSKDLTLVFDKGNNSKEAMEKIAASPFHFTGSLRPSTVKDLLVLPLEQYSEGWITSQDGKKRVTHALRTSKKIYGVERTVIVTHHGPSARAAKKTLEAHLQVAVEKLQALKDKVGQRGYRTVDAITKKARTIVSKKQIKGLFMIDVQENGKQEQEQEQEQYPVFSWQRDKAAILKRQQSFGKSTVFTDRDEWSTREIVDTYRSQWRVERDFRELKDPTTIRATPLYHWTDARIRVHFFTCVLSLLVLRLLHREVRQAGMDWSLEHVLGSLKGIKEVVAAVSYPPRLQHKLTKMSRDQKRLYTALNLHVNNKDPANNLGEVPT
jgi:transposase